MSQRIVNWFKFSSPQTFYPLAGKMVPWFAAAAAVLAAIGLYIGFFVAPTDFQQGEAYRIIFVHVPASWMSMFIYLVMAAWAGVGLALNSRLSANDGERARADRRDVRVPVALDRRAVGPADVGHLLGLGRAPHLGADPASSSTSASWRCRRRSTIRAAPTRPARCSRSSGVVNIPIIYFSVKWWNTLHQGASVSLTRAPTMATIMLTGMLVMVLAFWMYSIAVSLARVRAIILERERHAGWAQALGSTA